MKVVRLVASVMIMLAILLAGFATPTRADKPHLDAPITPNVNIWNRVYNPDFEIVSGNPAVPDGWVLSSGGTTPTWGVSTDAHSGTKSLSVNITPSTYFFDITTATPFTVTQYVPLYLSYAEKLPVGGANQMTVFVDIFNVSGARIYSAQMGYFASGQSWNYGQVNYSVVPPINSRTAILRLHMESGGQSQSVLFDNLSFGPSLARKSKTTH